MKNILLTCFFIGLIATSWGALVSSCPRTGTATRCETTKPCQIANCKSGSVISYSNCNAGYQCLQSGGAASCVVATGNSTCRSTTTGTTGRPATTGTTGRAPTTGTTGRAATTGTTGRATTGTTGRVATTGTTGTGVINPDYPPYYCPAAECAAKNVPGQVNCRCASAALPGGFARDQHPMFLSITFDDAFTDSYLTQADAFFANPTAVDAAGCNPKPVWFLLNDNTQYHKATIARAKYNSEIAVHTMTHTTRTTVSEWYNEIVPSRKITSDLTVTPINEIKGFRFPYLATKDTGFTVLQQNGFTYDSSLGDYLNFGASTATDFSWPYTLDYGSPQPCWSGDCVLGQFTGLWEIPMPVLYDNTGAIKYLMDPIADSQLLSLLKYNFDLHYNGNRAPMGIYLHYGPDRAAAVRQFWDYAASKPGVFFVNNKQIVDWMRNPTNIADTITRFRCSAASNATAPEVCDGLDNNKNGVIDENLKQTCSYNIGVFETCGTCYCNAPVYGTFDPYTAALCPTTGSSSTTGVPPPPPSTTGAASTTGASSTTGAASGTTGSSSGFTCSGKADGIYCDPAFPCKITNCVGGFLTRQNCPATLVCSTTSPTNAVCDWPPPGFTCPA